MGEYTLRKGYQHEAALRKEFVALIKNEFWVYFENWYQLGYWKDQFRQYTLFDGEKAISNVSAYTMGLEWNGSVKHCVQFGGVTTVQEHRNEGLSRIVMEEAIRENQEGTDFLFLLANHSVLDFYPLFGFRKCRQWQCSKDVHITLEKTVKQLSMKDEKDRAVVEEAVEKSVSNSLLEMKQGTELIMFYLTEYMQENVYYIESQDAYVAAEVEEQELQLTQVFADHVVDLDKVFEAFGKDIHHITLGFTPLKPEEYVETEITDPDDNLFIMGNAAGDFESMKCMVPLLSHT